VILLISVIVCPNDVAPLYFPSESPCVDLFSEKVELREVVIQPLINFLFFILAIATLDWV